MICMFIAIHASVFANHQPASTNQIGEEKYVNRKQLILNTLKEGDVYEHTDPPRALALYEQAANHAISWIDDNSHRKDGSIENIRLLLARSYRYYGIVCSVNGQFAKALDHYNKALDQLELITSQYLLEKPSEWETEKAKSLSAISSVFSRTGNFDQALDYLNQAAILYINKNDSSGHAQILNNMGILYARQIKYPQALENFEKALEIQTALGDREGIFQCLNNISGVYQEMGSYDNAIELLIKSSTIAKEIGSKAYIANTLGNLGVAYSQKGDFDRAMSSFNQAYTNAEFISDYTEMANNLNNMGNIFIKTQKFQTALSYFLQAYDLSQKVENIHLRNTCLNKLGEIYMELGELEKAIFYLEKSASLSLENKLFHQQAHAYRLLHEVYAQTGNFKKAYNYSLLLNNINDSIAQQKNISKTKELEIKFMAGVKQQEIEFLRKNSEIQDLVIKNQKKLTISLITLGLVMLGFVLLIYFRYQQKKKTALQLEKVNDSLLKANEIIADSNHTKDKFFSIITHDLRSPFLGLVGLTDLMVRDLESLEKEELKDYLSLTHRTSQNLFGLLENLLSWARLQTGKLNVQSSNVDSLEVIKEAVEVLENGARLKNIEIQTQASPNLMAWADRNMLLTIVRNLVNNAIKFSHPEKQILVKAAPINSHFIEFKVIDAGVGMTSDQIQDLFVLGKKQSTRGTNNEKGTGLGLILVKEMVELMGGTIAVTSKENEGSTFTFTIPSGKSPR